MFIGIPQSATGRLLKEEAKMWKGGAAWSSDGGTHAAQGVRRRQSKEEARGEGCVAHLEPPGSPVREQGLQGPAGTLKDTASSLHSCSMPHVKVGRGQQSWPRSRDLDLYVKLFSDDN